MRDLKIYRGRMNIKNYHSLFNKMQNPADQQQKSQPLECQMERSDEKKKQSIEKKSPATVNISPKNLPNVSSVQEEYQTIQSELQVKEEKQEQKLTEKLEQKKAEKVDNKS